MEFEWDEAKAQANLDKHGVAFRVAAVMFDGRPVLMLRSDRDGEVRFRTIAVIGGTGFTVIWTPRGNIIRVMSIRRARANEERAHRALHVS
jgi:uncharacterized protein